MKRILLTLTLALFWPFWFQAAPRVYYPRPAAQPVPAAVSTCPRCIGGKCALPAPPKELPAPPVKISGEIAPKEVK